jgi:uncharacterized protein YjiS (DUF1127 family)
MFDHIRDRFARWRLYRETTRKLRALDDHILGDLGIPRHDIKCHAREATGHAVWIR